MQHLSQTTLSTVELELELELKPQYFSTGWLPSWRILCASRPQLNLSFHAIADTLRDGLEVFLKCDEDGGMLLERAGAPTAAGQRPQWKSPACMHAKHYLFGIVRRDGEMQCRKILRRSDKTLLLEKK